MSSAPDTDLVTRFPTPQRARQVLRWNEREGGKRRHRRCSSSQIPYKMADGRVIAMHTVGCNEETLARVVYKHPDGGPNFAEVCVNDDAVHLWPRFSDKARGRTLEWD